MRTPYDRFAKGALSEILSRAGTVETEAEVVAERQAIDLACEPDPTRLHELRPFGVLGTMVRAGPCLFEFFHSTPTTGDVVGCIQKQTERRRRRGSRIASAPSPRLWIVAAGRPAKALRDLGFEMTEPGFASLPRGWGVSMVIVSGLPRERDTLVLRLLGSRDVLINAVAEFAALGPDSPERLALSEGVLALREELARAAGRRSKEDEEFLMSTQRYGADIARRLRDEGVAQGIARSILDLYELRFGAPPATIRASLDLTSDESILRQWLRLVATEARDDVDRALLTAS